MEPCNIKNNISQDLLVYIYHFYEGLYYQKKYNYLNTILHNEVSVKLDISDILPLIYEILDDINYIIFLQYNDSIFKNIYTSHIIQNKKYFKNLNVIDSLALSWLMYLHH